MKSSQQKNIIQLEGEIVLGGLWTDLMIEQCVIRSIKSRGSVTRCREMTDTVRLTWIHSTHACADVHNSTMELTNVQHKTSEQHTELGKNKFNVIMLILKR